MYRIKIFADYVTPSQAKKLFENVNRADTFPEYGQDKQIYFVEDDDQDFTHVLVLNNATPILPKGISKWNIVGLAHEPRQFLPVNLDYIQNNIGIYFIGDAGGLPYPFVAGQGYIPHAPSKTLYNGSSKPYIMSIMVSQKKFAPGHIYRHKLVEQILKTDLPIDIYGRGCSELGSDPRIKGTFNNPDVMLSDYKFHICIENFQSDYYFSEKIIDPMCYGVTPVYLGCRNIDEFLPGSIKLTGDIGKDMTIIREICSSPDKFALKQTAGDANINLIRNILDGKVFF
jgi:hypothetical protein